MCQGRRVVRGVSSAFTAVCMGSFSEVENDKRRVNVCVL